MELQGIRFTPSSAIIYIIDVCGIICLAIHSDSNLCFSSRVGQCWEYCFKTINRFFMNIKMIARINSMILFAEAIFMLPALFICLFDKNFNEAKSFIFVRISPDIKRVEEKK